MLVLIASMTSCDIRRIAIDELDAIEPLWNALREHHASVTPELGPPRSREESWARRRGQYEQWLESADSFALLAERRGEGVGYAMVHVRAGSPTWPLGERAGEIETLSVLPGERGKGTGTALLEAVRSELGELGIAELSLLAISTNRDAIRFYRRHGFGTHALWMRTSRGVGTGEGVESGGSVGTGEGVESGGSVGTGEGVRSGGSVGTGGSVETDGGGGDPHVERRTGPTNRS